MATKTVSAKLMSQLEKVKKSVKKTASSAARRIEAATAAKPRRARGEVTGRSKVRRAVNRTKRAAGKSVKTVARKAGVKARGTRAKKS